MQNKYRGVIYTHRNKFIPEKYMKAIKKAASKSGKEFLLTQDGETFGVYALCSNYCRHAKGGIAKSWRYVEKGLSRDAAERLLARRAA